MPQSGLVLITDRGGHLHDSLRLLEQMRVVPDALISTPGPDVDYLRTSSDLKGAAVITIPQAFTWFGKRRLWNPLKFLFQAGLAVRLAWRWRPRAVVSLGASNVVTFCYVARLLGARVYHVENLAQVVNPSVTGRLLYPICSQLYVQWPELLKGYGPKARYEGWVL